MKYITFILLGIITCMGGALWWLHGQYEEQKENNAALSLSVESMQKEKEIEESFSNNLKANLQLCQENSLKLAKQFDDITHKYSNAVPEPVKVEGVVNETLRKELRKDLSNPLPFVPAPSVR